MGSARELAESRNEEEQPEKSLSIYLFMRLDLPSGTALGPSRVAILEAIGRFGSLSAASRSVGLSYQQVWSTVKLLNKAFATPLVDIRVGGPSSGASLTSLGKVVVARFRDIEAAANRSLKKQLAGLEKLLGEDSKAPRRIPRWAQVRDGRRPKSKVASK